MTLPEKIKKYGLTSNDWFQHKHYTIITRMGIDKIQAFEKIDIHFDAVKVEPEFCVVKATGKKGTLTVETFGSSKYGGKDWIKEVLRSNGSVESKGRWKENGNTTTWYVMEMAEKRAMSRVVLKITGFYELGVFGEDESEDFKKESPKQEKPTELIPTPKRLTPAQVESIPNSNDLKRLQDTLKTFTLQPSEKEVIEKRIMELKK